MAFGQASGPPASAQQIRRLESLLDDAGHGGFKEARHPLGLTQRQAAGKFTSQEAAELIEQLEAAEEVGSAGGDPDDAGSDGTTGAVERSSASPVGATRASADERAARRLLSRQEEAIVELPSELLAMELERRGWTCIPSPDWEPPTP